jgi:hypothetical protein
LPSAFGPVSELLEATAKVDSAAKLLTKRHGALKQTFVSEKQDFIRPTLVPDPGTTKTPVPEKYVPMARSSEQ